MKAITGVAANADSKGAQAKPVQLGTTSPERAVSAQGQIDAKATQGQVESVAMDGTETMSTMAKPIIRQ